MSRYVDGIPVATNIFEAAAWHKVIQVTCAFGHAVTFDPHGLWWLFERKGWDMRFAEARRRFRCRRCGYARRAKLAPASIEPTDGSPEVVLPMPPAREWRRALSLLRS
jgi:hypothetical protein